MFGLAHASSPNVEALTARCEALETADLSAVQDAPTQVLTAKPVAATDDAPAHCQVEGYVTPQVGFEVRLPSSKWNGNFLAVGNGGWGGEINGDACNAYL